MSRVVLIRHGITEGNKKKWFYGHADLPLIPEGIDELVKQKREGIYPELSDDALCFTTGLRRTNETFRIIFGERPFEAIEELREINFGIFECKSFDDLKYDAEFQEWMYDEMGDFRLTEGESKNQFRERVHRGFRYIIDRHNALAREQGAESTGKPTADDDLTVIVSHGGVIAEIMQVLFPQEKESIWDWMPEPGSGYVLGVEDGKVREYCLLGRINEY